MNRGGALRNGRPFDEVVSQARCRPQQCECQCDEADAAPPGMRPCKARDCRAERTAEKEYPGEQAVDATACFRSQQVDRAPAQGLVGDRARIQQHRGEHQHGQS